MEKVLTSKALWQDFDPQSEPLESDVLKIEENDGITTKTVYFTGRTVEDGKTRVLAKICYNSARKSSNALLLIDNYKKPIKDEELRYWAQNGFTTMAIDFGGRSSSGISTLYPPSLDYCNGDVAQGYFYVGTSAKQTKIYEYALNCMRAVTYLLQEEKAKKISVLTVKKGSAVGIIVLGTDTRLTNGAVVFGSLSRAYAAGDLNALNALNNDKLSEQIANEEKRQIWEAGIAPQSYAMQITVPVYLVIAANSTHVSAYNSNKMYYRMNDDCRIHMIPLSIDYMTDENLQSVVNFFKGKNPPKNIEIEQITTEQGDNFLKVNSPLPTSKLEVWYSRTPERRCRNWVQAKLKNTPDGCIAELDAYAPKCKMIAYAIAKGAVDISTTFCDVEINNPSFVKSPNRSVFIGEKVGHMIPFVAGSAYHGSEQQVEFAKGYLDIVGAKGTSLASFALNDPCVNRPEIFTISFDVCCSVAQPLSVRIVSDFRSNHEVYQQTVQLLGDGKWQRITLDGVGFKKVGGRQIDDQEDVKMLHFEARSEFIINNVFIV